MTQERLNGLATIALEIDVLEKINYEDIIEAFISTNTRRMMLFHGMCGKYYVDLFINNHSIDC